MLDNFLVGQYQIEIRGREQLILPEYKGSTLRGAFGKTFRRLCCAQSAESCRDCLLKENCPYAYIFETAPASGTEVLRNYESVPRPFVLEPPPTMKRVFAPGEPLLFNLILIGRAIEFLPYFIVTFRELGNLGIGKGKGRFELSGIRAKNLLTGAVQDVYRGDGLVHHDNLAVSFANLAALPLPSEKNIKITFATMTRLVYRGRLIDRPEFHIIVRSLLGRISSLAYFHCGEKLEMDYSGIIAAAEEVRLVGQDTGWVDWERYSSRQHSRMKMGGIVGTACYECPTASHWSSFWPWLKLGELVHLGKNTVFGLGKMVVCA